jgi:inosose dehydratase
VRIGCHTITWGGVFGSGVGVTSAKDAFYVTAGDTETALREIAEIGYEGVELFDGDLLRFPGDLGSLLESTGLALIATYVGGSYIYRDTLEEELWRAAEAASAAAALGAEHLVVGGGARRYDRAPDDADYDALAYALNRVASLATQHGLTASYHPHLTTMAEAPEEIAKVFDRTAIGFCPDTAHLAAAGGDVRELVARYRDRVYYVHLKDLTRDPFAFEPLGRGELDLRGLLADLRSSGFDGWVATELDSYDGPPAAAARESFAFLSGEVRTEAL